MGCSACERMNRNDDVKKVICLGCGANCGHLVRVRNGRVLDIKGDPEQLSSQGHICQRAISAVELLYHRDRLMYPLKRIGKRGQGIWERVTWNQAMDEIAEKLRETKEKYGPEAIALSHGTDRTADHLEKRFMNLLGSPNMFGSGSQVCWCNTVVIECITYGWMATSDDLEHSRCIVEWGGNSAHSSPLTWRKILDAKKKGTKLIVIDPRLTETASKADIWLQPRPGTDCALIMGWLNVIVNEKLYDKDFVESWTFGFEKLQERVNEYPPEKVAEITHVPAEKTRESAKVYATNKPASIDWSVSLDHIGRNATQAIRARAILRAVTGNLDVSGGQLLRGVHPKLIPEAELEENGKIRLEQRKKLLGAERFKLFAWDVYDQIDRYARKAGFKTAPPSAHLVNAHAPTVWRTVLAGKPYQVRALICVANNPLMSFPNTKLVYEAIKKLELFVVHDIFMTPSAMLADYVLPAATWLERPYLSTGVGVANFVITGDRAVEPLGECKTDFDFLRELGVRLDQEWPWKNMEELYEYQLKPLGYTWKDFVTKIRWDVPTPKYRKYEEVGFATPSGKVEIYSSILEKLGYDPLPNYEEPVESPVSMPELAEDYPLILINGGRFRPMFQSEYRQVESLRRMHPDPLVQIHPETARELDIKSGDWVWIETRLGRIKQKAKLDSGIDRNVVHAEHGWWFPEKPGEEPTLYGLWESNVNVIIDDDLEKCDPMVGSWQLRLLQCKIYKA